MGPPATVDGLIARIGAAQTRPELQAPLDELAGLASEGDQAAVDALLATIDAHGLAQPAIKRLLFNPDDQADVAQDVLVAVAQSIRTFRGEAQMLTWLHSVATNCAMTFLRRKRQHDDLTPVEASWGARFTSIASNQMTVQQAIADLPDKYRDAVTLRDMAQLPYVDVAERLGLNLNTTRAHIARGRALVSAALGGSVAGLEGLHPSPADPGP